MISAKIILDSISEDGARITTMELVMPRIILAEFNTHRAFSRNSASSRAVSVEKKIREVRENPFIPLKWTRNKKGMQGENNFTKEQEEDFKDVWKEASKSAVAYADHLNYKSLHKQVVNRLLEPFLWHTVLVTATEWDNFFEQRCSPLAEPHMEMLAWKMKEVMEWEPPIKLTFGEWHLPFVYGKPLGEDTTLKTRILVSAARCARVSYQKHGVETKWEEDLEIGRKLLAASPPHWSPFEHQAQAFKPNDCEFKWMEKTLKYKDSTNTGNFQGWIQARHHKILIDKD